VYVLYSLYVPVISHNTPLQFILQTELQTVVLTRCVNRSNTNHIEGSNHLSLHVLFPPPLSTLLSNSKRPVHNSDLIF
jgi:hypothetical protein